MTEETTLFERVSNWIKNSVTLKLVTIAILTLLLLIPAIMIEEVIYERETLSMQTIDEVSSKWAKSQQLNGPILTIPLIYEYNEDDKKILVTKYWHLLPETLNIDGAIEPERLRRGIYEVVVYKSNISVEGNFDLNQEPDMANLKEIKYEQSFLTIGISDLRGIKNQINFNWDEQELTVKPGSKISNLAYSGVTVDLPDLEGKMDKKVSFEFALDLRGSQNMSFIPIGNTTNVNLSSNWESPSFNGNFLPDSRELGNEGFTASWQILQLNRNFPQSWIDTDQSIKMNEAAFGVDLLVQLDDYQKSTRSAKYAIMTIAITFLVFFLVEILNKRKIHPFQYTLVGFALCLFYILLVSISEHANFNIAYGISTVAVVGMITLYATSVFKSIRLVILLALILLGAYSFLFITIQLVDYALLMGSIGLSIILAATMYFTRNINWYKLDFKTN